MSEKILNHPGKQYANASLAEILLIEKMRECDQSKQVQISTILAIIHNNTINKNLSANFVERKAT